VDPLKENRRRRMLSPEYEKRAKERIAKSQKKIDKEEERKLGKRKFTEKKKAEAAEKKKKETNETEYRYMTSLSKQAASGNKRAARSIKRHLMRKGKK